MTTPLTLEILCLANSKKHGGRCVAGLRMDGQGWVRPVNEGVGTLYPEQYIVRDGNGDGLEVQPLDVVRLAILRHEPKPHQPENWRVDFGTKWELVGQPAPTEARQLLRTALRRGPDLLQSCEEFIPLRDCERLPLRDSLALVYPRKVRWRVGISNKGNRQVRVMFALGNTEYRLPVTDPLWLTRTESLPNGEYDQSADGLLDAKARLLFTISLGEPFEQKCYKLVAAVICVPPEWIGA